MSFTKQIGKRLMSWLDKVILRLYGHSFDAFGLLTVPTLLFTVMVAALAIALPGKELFWFGVWCAAGILHAIGVYWARQIRLKHENSTDIDDGNASYGYDFGSSDVSSDGGRVDAGYARNLAMTTHQISGALDQEIGRSLLYPSLLFLSLGIVLMSLTCWMSSTFPSHYTNGLEFWSSAFSWAGISVGAVFPFFGMALKLKGGHQ